MMKALGFLVLTVLAAAIAAPQADAQAPLPFSVSMVFRRDTGQVEVRGSAAPGTVVSVKGATAIVGKTGAFALRTRLPISLVAVRDSHIRRLRIDLPERAERWISRLAINANLTRMQATVAGNLTMTSHPAATVIVHHVEAEKTIQTTLTHGAFRLGLPLVSQTNTLDWAVRVGGLQMPAPSVIFTVQ